LKELPFLRVPNFSLRETKAQRDESRGRILLGDDTRRRQCHAAAHRLPVWWSLDFNWIPVWTLDCTYNFSIYLRKFWLAPECDYCL